ncbi:unnamed protein product [Effrenium voratum]|uniref:Uncharacterized protein n=1 Tax=Effrenium voratum TaxID=2562239 RepID=A0AA36HR85_9DINO|nr:unnamed protein product [Effrenium voratum]
MTLIIQYFGLSLVPNDMKLFALVLAVAFAMVSGDEVQHLRGESKSAAKDEESPAVGAVVAEPKEPKEPQSTMDQVPKPAGDVDKEESKGAVGPKAGKLDSPKETEPDVGVVFEEVEGTEEEAEDETSEKEKAAHRPGRRRPWGPSRVGSTAATAGTEASVAVAVVIAQPGAAVVESLERDFDGDTELADERGTTPLLLASALGKAEIVEALMERRADLMAGDVEGDNALMMAVAQNHADIVRKLLDASSSVDPDVQNKIGQTALMKAASKRNMDCVRMLLDAGANLNTKSKGGKTALVEAAEKNNLEVAQVLLKAGADASIADSNGMTALFPAAFRCDEPMLQLLLSSRADAAAKAERIGTALMMAVDSMDFKPSAVRLLLEHGCPADEPDARGATALMKAVEEGNAAAVQALLDAKANAAAKNQEGKTALDLAKRSGNASLEQLLRVAFPG